VGVSTVEVKYVAVVSTPGDPRSALAVEPDGRALDASLNLATPAVLGVEAVKLGEQEIARKAAGRTVGGHKQQGPARREGREGPGGEEVEEGEEALGVLPRALPLVGTRFVLSGLQPGLPLTGTRGQRLHATPLRRRDEAEAP